MSIIGSPIGRGLKPRIVLVLAAGAMSIPAQAQAKPPSPIPETDTSFIDSTGTAHITRVVPVPTTISPEARAFLSRPQSGRAGGQSLAAQRAATDAQQARAGERFRSEYPLKTISSETIAGVPVRIFTPLAIPNSKQGRVLIYLHGGGFITNSGVMTGTIPIANLTETKVIAVLYRLAPEHPFPAAVEDAVAVYRELLKTYKPQSIGVYGSSAGAILTAEAAVKLDRLGLPLPAALGIFSGMGDFTRTGDSQSLFSVNGLSGSLNPHSNPAADAYVGSTSRTDPVLSPIYANLKGMPPTLFVSSGRDMLLSGTTILHRAFLRAGVDARLVVFEALPHTFWNNPLLPESKEADRIMASFFDRQLGKSSGSRIAMDRSASEKSGSPR